MNNQQSTILKKLLLIVAGFLLTAFPRLASAKVMYYDGFEAYTVNSNIAGQVTGSTSWTTQGVIAGDSAIVSNTDAANDGGGNSLYLSQTVTGNRPRASVDLVAGGFLSSAIPSGSVAFSVCEDPNNGAGTNWYTINIGAMTLMRYVSGSTGQLCFTVTGGGTAYFSLTGSNYHYTPGAWNDCEVAFDNVAKAASLYINDQFVGTISGTGANYSVSGITFGLYSSSCVSDKVYFDALAFNMTGSQYYNSFEAYATGTTIIGQVSGSTTWTGSVGAGDQLVISNSTASVGSKSLNLVENGAHASMATSLNFSSGGFLSGSSIGGTFSIDVNEQPNSAGAIDSFKVGLGYMTIMRGGTTNISATLSDSTGATLYQLTVPTSTDNYTYTPGQWNTFGLTYDNTAQNAVLSINGGYAGTIATGTLADFTVKAMSIAQFSSSVYTNVFFDNVAADFNGAPSVFPWRSSLYPADWSPNPATGTPGYVDANGHSIQDFSYAGYHSGTTSIPTVSGPNYIDVTQAPYNADNTGTTDATAAIQNAINYVGTNGGGVVYLPAGTYHVAPLSTSVPGSLSIRYSNVVLRGAGAGQTYILNTATMMQGINPTTNKYFTQHIISVVSTTPTDWFSDNVGNGGGGSGNSSILTVPLQGDLPAESNVVPVTSVTGFNVGDLVMVRNDLTTAFLNQLGSSYTKGWWAGNHANLVMIFARRITAIDSTAKTITIDVPTRYPLLLSANARVVKPLTSAPMLQEVGVENFSIGNIENSGTNDWSYLQDNAYITPGTPAWQVSGCTAVQMVSAENCWIRNVSSYHPAQNTMSTPFTSQIELLSNGIWLANTRLITVSGCNFGYSQYDGSGGNGYMYAMAGQETLVQNCSAAYGRHNISFDLMQASGNVFLSCTVAHCRQSSDFHQMLSPANLLDCTVSDGDVLESYPHTTAQTVEQGWTTTQSVFWNTTWLSYGKTTDGTSWKALIYAADYNTGTTPVLRNYIIGTQGPASGVYSVTYAEGIGQGSKLIPQSLYLDQRRKRVGF